MRFSRASRHKIEDVIVRQASNLTLFEEVALAVPVERRAGTLLLLGGSDRRSLALRDAQSASRLDRLPSHWSHCAVIASWPGEAADAVGLEASFDPENPLEQVPERNAVTPFRLERYFDAVRYPNLCVASFTFDDEGTSPLPVPEGHIAHRAALREALREPNQDRLRFPIWDQFGVWSKYFYSPEAGNPLYQGHSVPSVTYCAYVFAAAGIDLAAAANCPHAAPEHIWASLLRWTHGMRASVQLWRSVLQPDLSHEMALSSGFDTVIPDLASP